MTRASAVLALAAAVLLSSVPPGGTGSAQAPQPQQPVFRAGIDVVQVDVSVLDRLRRPVRGLEASEFTVLEDGVPQSIVAFVPIEVAEADPIDTKWMRDVQADVRSNDLGDGRLFAIVMDDATIPPDPQLVNRARAIGRDVVNRLGPSDLAAVIFTRDNRHAVDFTNDRARLLEAVGKMSPGFAYSAQRMNDELYWFFSSISTLGRVSSYLRTVPQRRKAIVYVSTGVPVDPEAASEAVAIGGSVEALLERDLATELMRNTQETFTAALQETYLRAQHGNVNIYAIDPSGVGGLNFYFQSQTVLPADPFTQGVRQRGMMEGLQLSRLNQEFLQTISEQSGGRAVINANTFDEGIAQIFRENSSYYLLGYQSTRPREDRTVRRVEVKVSRPDVEVRTRSAYFNEEAAPLPPETAPAIRLTNALAGILPNPDVELHATAAPFAIPGRGEAALAIALGVRQPPPMGVEPEVGETLEVLVSAFTSTGDPRGSLRKTIRLTARTGEPLAYDVLARLDLPPGRYQLRVAAESALAGRSGSVYVEAVVPNFAREPLSLSGVVLSATGGAPSMPAGAFHPLVPLDPTSRRSFSAADQVRAFVQVYQGSSGRLQPVDLEIRITDARDSVVSRTRESLAPDRFAGDHRGADYGFEVPLSRLQPGRYLLTVEVSRGGRSVKRDIPFDIR
jgi:VWFA-related protein